MKFLKKLLGIKKLETQISQNKTTSTNNKNQIKTLLTKPTQSPNQTKPTQSPNKTKTLLSKPNNNKPLILPSTKAKAIQTKTLQILKNPTSTTQLSKSLKITRSYASKILNKLETGNKIYEHSKSGRTIFYKKL